MRTNLINKFLKSSRPVILFLSVPEALNQYPQAEPMRSILQPWTIPLVDTFGKSQGYRQDVNLRPGLNVLINDYTLQDDLIVETDNVVPCTPELSMEMSFMVSGHNRLEAVRSCHNLFVAIWRESSGGQFHWQADERVLKGTSKNPQRLSQYVIMAR